MKPARAPGSWHEQASDAWAALRRDAIRRSWRSTRVRDGPWTFAGPAAAWGLSQVLTAAVDLLALGAIDGDEVDRLFRGLERHRVGAAYGALPGDRTRYYDDNAWIALAHLQAHLVTLHASHLEAARRLLSFLAEGERDGGIYWQEMPKHSRHTCSTAPAAQLAFHLHLIDPDPETLALGTRAMWFLTEHLCRADGLFADNVDDDGTLDPAVYSYNQGTPVGAEVLRYRITGDRVHLDRARATADAALVHFGNDDRLWLHPPAFNAVFLRNLLVLDAVDAFPAAVAVTESYLDRVWSAARDPATGWFTGGGIGRYERGGVLDQAALVQLFAIMALPREGRLNVC